MDPNDYQLSRTGRLYMSTIYARLELLQVDLLCYEKLLHETGENGLSAWVKSVVVAPEDSASGPETNAPGPGVNNAVAGAGGFNGIGLCNTQRSFDFNPTDLATMATEADTLLKQFIAFNKKIFDQIHCIMLKAKTLNEVAYGGLFGDMAMYQTNVQLEQNKGQFWGTIAILRLCKVVFGKKAVCGEPGETPKNKSKNSSCSCPCHVKKATAIAPLADEELAEVCPPPEKVEEESTLIEAMNAVIMRWVADLEGIRKHILPYLSLTKNQASVDEIAASINQLSLDKTASNTITLVPFYLESLGETLKSGRLGIWTMVNRLHAILEKPMPKEYRQPPFKERERQEVKPKEYPLPPFKERRHQGVKPNRK